MIIIMIMTIRMTMKMAMGVMSKKQAENSVERAGDGDAHDIIL